MDLLPYLTGENKDAPHATGLFWRYGRKHAAHKGDWKLTDQGDGAKLYNLAADIGEKNDLAAKELAKVQELQAAYDKWNERNIPAKWGGEGKHGKRKPAKKPTAVEQQAYLAEDDP